MTSDVSRLDQYLNYLEREAEAQADRPPKITGWPEWAESFYPLPPMFHTDAKAA